MEDRRQTLKVPLMERRKSPEWRMVGATMKALCDSYSQGGNKLAASHGFRVGFERGVELVGMLLSKAVDEARSEKGAA